ncbi:MAG: aldose epimerase family protein [Terracidiphilus sp.]|jgi:aldose 1-epimerase
MASPISSRTFGVLPAGQTVEAWTLTGRGGLVLEAITYGGIVTRLLAPGRDGIAADVVLGFNDLDSYLDGHPYFGAITGRVAGRISNAAFTLDGHTYQLARNDPPNHLHGGVVGFDKRLWSAAPVDREDGAPSLRLTYLSPDGEEGYPGNVQVAVTYTVTNHNVFLIETEAVSDRITPLSLTHHSYFNLAGESSGSIADHRLEIFASEFVPADEYMTLTGRLESTSRHGNDIQTPRRIGDMIGHLFQGHGDLYALPKPGSEMRLAARLEDPASGRVMTVSTTENYLQLYTGSHLNGALKGKSGVAYAPHAGICLECEGYPDASNAARRADILLHPGQTQRHATAYGFSVRSANASGNERSGRSAPGNHREGTSDR